MSRELDTFWLVDFSGRSQLSRRGDPVTLFAFLAGRPV